MQAAQQSVQSLSGTSRNWAGYSAQNGQYTRVSGTWTVPSVTGGSASSADATWVGIGGITSNDLIQSGTMNMVTPDGQVTTSAFYELLPDAPVTIPTVATNPGDSVTVSISQRKPDQWHISFADTTNGQTFSTTVSYASSLSSAEWIEEAPSDGWTTVPLDSFGSASFTSGSTNQGTIAASGAQPLTMVDDQAQTLATPSAFGSDGASFTVSDQQTGSYQQPSIGQQPGTDGGDPYSPWGWVTSGGW
jgi:hypothetical protein